MFVHIMQDSWLSVKLIANPFLHANKTEIQDLVDYLCNKRKALIIKPSFSNIEFLLLFVICKMKKTEIPKNICVF